MPENLQTGFTTQFIQSFGEPQKLSKCKRLITLLTPKYNWEYKNEAKCDDRLISIRSITPFCVNSVATAWPSLQVTNKDDAKTHEARERCNKWGHQLHMRSLVRSITVEFRWQLAILALQTSWPIIRMRKPVYGKQKKATKSAYERALYHKVFWRAIYRYSFLISKKNLRHAVKIFRQKLKILLDVWDASNSLCTHLVPQTHQLPW